MKSSNPHSETRLRVWDAPVRLFHWLLALTIFFAFMSAEEESPLAAWHEPAGWIAAILVAFRVAWGFMGGEHARFSDFIKPAEIGRHVRAMMSGKPERSIGHNALGALAIVALLGTIAAVVVTGAALGSGGGEDLHEIIGYGLLGLIAVHVVAVIVTSLLTRENLIAAFITGSKNGRLHPGAQDARGPATLAIPVAAVVIGASAYAVTIIDSDAFLAGTRSDAVAQSESLERVHDDE